MNSPLPALGPDAAPPTRRACWRRRALVAAGVLAMAPLGIWCMAALWVDGPSARWVAAPLALAYLASLAAIAWRVRPAGRALAAALLPMAAVLGWWLAIKPSNDRQWQPEVARMASARPTPDGVVIQNVRNFAYRAKDDFDERWEERAYDLDQVVAMDMFLSSWGAKGILHTIASWEFASGEHLAISIETRKEVGEGYSALLGFFRQYELHYVVADERDVIGVRAAHRGEDVRLHRLNHPPQVARALLEDYLETINSLAERPQWYNALTHNCTTTIRHHAQAIGAAQAWDWRLLVNGRIDEVAHERGEIDNSMPLEELRRRCDVTEAAKQHANSPDFSARIREGVPGFE